MNGPFGSEYSTGLDDPTDNELDLRLDPKVGGQEMVGTVYGCVSSSRRVSFCIAFLPGSFGSVGTRGSLFE